MKNFTTLLNTRRLAKFVYAAGLVGLLLTVVISLTGGVVLAAPLMADAPLLGAADSFSVLAALSMSAAGAGTTVEGDLGLSPGLETSRTGSWTVGGTEYFGPLSLAADAQAAALAAYNNMTSQTSDGAWSGAVNPVAGVWTDAGDVTFDGTLTLSGNYDDVWVFQIGNDMTFSGSVVMAGNAQPCNVFWQIGRDATIASGSTFIGTIIASRDITLVSGANVNGRVISLNSSLTTDGNSITRPICQVAPTPTATTGPTGTAGPTATLLPIVTALPPTGGAPIRSEAFPWSMVIAAGIGIVGFVLFLGMRAIRSTDQPK